MNRKEENVAKKKKAKTENRERVVNIISQEERVSIPKPRQLMLSEKRKEAKKN